MTERLFDTANTHTPEKCIQDTLNFGECLGGAGGRRWREFREIPRAAGSVRAVFGGGAVGWSGKRKFDFRARGVAGRGGALAGRR